MKILIIDNYDSFTYNLVHMVEEIINQEVVVVKNDKIDAINIPDFDAIILSPGPGIPSEAGDLLRVIKEYSPQIPTLGICLGHQALAEIYNAKLMQLEHVHHGIGSNLKLESTDRIYQNLVEPIQVGRYHSWAINHEDLPDDLIVTARDENGIIMSIKHKKLPITSVQFHPESILTPQGKQMITNWINSIK